jgi:hypothetical protein
MAHLRETNVSTKSAARNKSWLQLNEIRAQLDQRDDVVAFSVVERAYE